MAPRVPSPRGAGIAVSMSTAAVTNRLVQAVATTFGNYC